MRAFVSLSIVVLLAALPTGWVGRTAASEASYQIVVHPSQATVALERRFLEDAFLKRVKLWPGGQVIRPVDLGARSPVRRRFSEEVLRRPVEAVRAYWQQRIFAGRDVPPPELATDEDVVSYVSRHAGAIGYVSATAATPGIKIVAIK